MIEWHKIDWKNIDLENLPWKDGESYLSYDFYNNEPYVIVFDSGDKNNPNRNPCFWLQGYTETDYPEIYAEINKPV